MEEEIERPTHLPLPRPRNQTGSAAQSSSALRSSPSSWLRSGLRGAYWWLMTSSALVRKRQCTWRMASWGLVQHSWRACSDCAGLRSLSGNCAYWYSVAKRSRWVCVCGGVCVCVCGGGAGEGAATIRRDCVVAKIMRDGCSPPPQASISTLSSVFEW